MNHSTNIFGDLDRQYNLHEAFEPFNNGEDYFEFTLEELGLPSADELRHGCESIREELGEIYGWTKGNQESKKYRGFSPVIMRGDVDPWYKSPRATLGHPELNWSHSRSTNENPPWETDYNTYYDTYAFNELHPLAKKHLGSFYDSVDLMPSRGRVVWGEGGHEQQWHKDEPWIQALRYNIPLITEKNSTILQIDGSWGGNQLTKTVHMEVGKVYIWNFCIDHRVVNYSEKTRLNLIQSFATWFNFDEETNEYVENDFYGIQPLHMIKLKMPFPNAQ